MQKTNYENEQLNIEIDCYIDKKNKIWFRGKEIALTLGYKNTRKAIIDHVHEDDKQLIEINKSQISKTHTKSCKLRSNDSLPLTETLEKTYQCVFINESGFYSLILSSKLPIAKEFKYWVTNEVLPSIRKKGYYNINSNRLMIDSEYDLHCNVVSFIRNKYPEALMIAGLGENQKTNMTRLTSWKKGYMAGQCDLMLMNPTSKYNSLCIEFKDPKGDYKMSEKQLEMKQKYIMNKCKYIMSNCYNDIIFEVIKHMEESEKYIRRYHK